MAVPDWYERQYWEDVERESIAEADREFEQELVDLLVENPKIDYTPNAPPRPDYCDGLELFPSNPLRCEFPDDQTSVND